MGGEGGREGYEGGIRGRDTVVKNGVVGDLGGYHIWVFRLEGEL